MMLLAHVLHGAALPPSSFGDAVLRHWTFDPGVAIAIGLTTTVYAAGVMRVWNVAGRGRGISPSSAASFAGGMIALIAALMSPLDELADQLQAAHMVQHLLLIVVVPPLVLLGEPVRGLVWGLPGSMRRKVPRLWRNRVIATSMSILVTPSIAFALHAAALVIWHMPGPYDSAVHSDLLHAAEHLCFLGTALLFWWVVLSRVPFRRLSMGMRIPYVVGMSFVGAAIGAVLTFAASPFYDVYRETAPSFGLSALEDQQLAGLIMWIPGGAAYLTAAALLFIAWMEAAGTSGARAEILNSPVEAR